MFAISAWCHRRLLLLPLLAAVAACGDDTPAPTAPSAPATPITVPFSGTLTRNSAVTHPFSVSDAGLVKVSLVTSADSASPDNPIPLGVGLGIWNGVACGIVIASDNVSPGSTITGQATAAGNLCVRVYDVGFVPTASTYELRIEHF